jgi:thiol-disulfide isomerase/thioredoxin
MNEDDMEKWLDNHHYTFVNYYAPWCVWCQRLEPVWEAFAEAIAAEDLPVSIVKVDCAANAKLCTEQRVMVRTLPPVRFFLTSRTFSYTLSNMLCFTVLW